MENNIEQIITVATHNNNIDQANMVKTGNSPFYRLYSSTKEVVDKMIVNYTSKRRTNRFHVIVFTNTVHISVTNTCIFL